jgi:hypothetical protein
MIADIFIFFVDYVSIQYFLAPFEFLLTMTEHTIFLHIYYQESVRK